MPKKPSTVRVLAILSTKGGVGKSTLTVHLAVEAARKKERVLVLDADPQTSCATWGELREREHPAVETIDVSDVPARLDRAGTEGYTVCIVDTAPRATGTLATMLKCVDYALIPVRPSAVDLVTVEQSLDIVQAARIKGAIILSACPSRALEVDEMRAALSDRALPLCSVTIGERTSFRRAFASGRAVTEFEPRGKAASEITRLWAYTRKAMQ